MGVSVIKRFFNLGLSPDKKWKGWMEEEVKQHTNTLNEMNRFKRLVENKQFQKLPESIKIKKMI